MYLYFMHYRSNLSGHSKKVKFSGIVKLSWLIHSMLSLWLWRSIGKFLWSSAVNSPLLTIIQQSSFQLIKMFSNTWAGYETNESLNLNNDQYCAPTSSSFADFNMVSNQFSYFRNLISSINTLEGSFEFCVQWRYVKNVSEKGKE